MNHGRRAAYRAQLASHDALAADRMGDQLRPDPPALKRCLRSTARGSPAVALVNSSGGRRRNPRARFPCTRSGGLVYSQIFPVLPRRCAVVAEMSRQSGSSTRPSGHFGDSSLRSRQLAARKQLLPCFGLYCHCWEKTTHKGPAESVQVGSEPDRTSQKRCMGSCFGGRLPCCARV